MNQRLILLVALIGTATAHRTSAAVFERDWKTTGDGLLTYDDVNQREWLDLSVSRLDQFPEPRLQNAIAQIAPGGLFDGFSWAIREDVTVLAASGGIDVTTLNFSLNEGATIHFTELLGITVQTAESRSSIGFIDEQTTFPGFPPRQVAADFLVNYTSGGSGLAGLRISSSGDFLGASTNGLMLYRVVPEPSLACISLGGIGSLVCMLRRCRARVY